MSILFQSQCQDTALTARNGLIGERVADHLISSFASFFHRHLNISAVGVTSSQRKAVVAFLIVESQGDSFRQFHFKLIAIQEQVAIIQSDSQFEIIAFTGR